MAIYIVPIVAVCWSCAPLRLERSIRTGDMDWIMYGGGMERTNVAPCGVTPPLVRVWSHSASGGFSVYSASTAESLLFVPNLQGEIQIIRVPDGRELTSHDFGSSIFGSPVIQNDTIYVAMSRDPVSLFAYTLTTATTQWKRKIGDIETSPLVIGRRLYVTTYGGELVCLDRSTGDLNWKYRVPEMKTTEAIPSSPASNGSIIVFGCDDGTLYAVSADSGTLSWRTAAARGSIVGSPSISDGRVFVGSLDSTFYALSLDSGKVLWRRALGSRIFGSQAVASGRVYTGTAGGELYCLDMINGSVIWNRQVGGILDSAPLVSDSVVYAGCADKNVYAFSALNGKPLGDIALDGRIKAGPIACYGYLVVLDDTHTISAFHHRNE